MIGKLLNLVLCIVLVITLCSCSKEAAEEPSYGSFQDVEVSEGSAKETKGEESYFTAIDSNHYTKWQTVKSAFGKMQFQIPERWQAELVNARFIKITTPADDPHLPATTFNIIYHHLYFHEAYDNVDEFDSLFESDRTGLTYNIDGTEYFELHEDPVVTAKYSDTEIGDDSLTSCNIIGNVQLGDGFGYSPRKDLIGVHYSISVNGIPMQIRTVAAPEKEQVLKDILSEVVSTISAYEYPVTSTIEAAFENSSIMLPAEFKEVRSGGVTFYQAPADTNSPFAGIMVYEEEVECDLADFDKEKFASEQVPVIAKTFFPSSVYDVICEKYMDDPYTVNAGNLPLTFLYANVNYFAREDRGAEFYGNASNAIMLMYLLPSETETHNAICMMLLSTQEDAMNVLLDCGNQTIKKK